MPRRLALLTTLALAAPALAVAAHATAPVYRVRALALTVTVPSAGTLGTTRCVVDADLYTPVRASRSHPVPAVLSTNSYGGSKSDLAALGRAWAAKGYVVLAYSGLGFGSDPQTHRRGTDCKITFDDREHDGAAGRQLVDFLGGLRAADDGTRIDYVRKDRVAHDGRAHRGDPRVGVIGASYGGQAAFAVAAADPRVDTIVPLVTWNDLAYSLSPNSTSVVPGTVASRVPGTQKVQWTGAFLEQGTKSGALGAAAAATRTGPCPNFSDAICKALSTTSALGYADAGATSVLRHASVASYLKDVRVPVLLGQGETDALFPLREAIATYSGLRARHVPVAMVWQQWGHGSVARAHEFGYGLLDTTYEGRLVRDWFGYWLKGEGRRPALDFRYYQSWRDHGDAGKAFATAPSYPLPGTTTLYASGTALQPSAALLARGSIPMVAPGSAPMSYWEPTPLVAPPSLPDLPAATAVLSTRPLTRDVDVIGAPTATLRLASQTANGAHPGSMLVAFVKLYDVAPDGTLAIRARLAAPIRVADLSRPVVVSLPALVHRFREGHRLQLVVSLTDFGYRGNTQTQVALLTTSAAAPTTLTLPGRLDPAAFSRG